MQRKHSDVLIAVLLGFGVMMWVAMAAYRVLPGFGDLHRVIVLVGGAFLAAQIARRLLVDLELGATVLAALIAIALSLGIFAQQRYVKVELEMAFPFGAAGLGALLGALSSRRRSLEVRGGWRVLGAGLAGFGAMLLAAGAMALVHGDSTGYLVLAAFLGGALGPFLVALFAGADHHQCAQGLALVAAGVSLTVAPGIVEAVGGVVFGVVIGTLVGALGGAVGARIRKARKPAHDLPEAQVR